MNVSQCVHDPASMFLPLHSQWAPLWPSPNPAPPRVVDRLGRVKLCWIWAKWGSSYIEARGETPIQPFSHSPPLALSRLCGRRVVKLLQLLLSQLQLTLLAAISQLGTVCRNSHGALTQFQALVKKITSEHPLKFQWFSFLFKLWYWGLVERRK